MSDNNNENFHHFALETLLFKGRPDLYFCYLKTEKIAHALMYLTQRNSAQESTSLEALLQAVSLLPGTLARLAAGQIDEASVLAELFEVLSLVRVSVSANHISETNGRIIVQEYENIARKIALEKNASPLSLQDLQVEPLPAKPERSAALLAPRPLENMSLNQGQNKGHSIGHKGHDFLTPHDPMTERSADILKIIQERKRVSIKDIAKVIQSCSEKTLQRDLASLIRRGLIRKEGERRWSVYLPV